MIVFNSIKLYDLLFYFIIYSFMGWVMESSFKSLLYQKPINSGFLRGPFIPIYAIGSLTVLTFFTPFIESTIFLFFLGFVGMTFIEFMAGYIMEKIFNISWWDYRGNFMNIGGKICLENSIYWGILSVALLKYIHPAIQNIVVSIPIGFGEKMLFTFIIYFIIDYTLTLIEVLDIQEKVKQFLLIKENPIILATTNKVSELKSFLIKRSKRLVTAYPKLTYLKVNKKLKDIIGKKERIVDKNIK